MQYIICHRGINRTTENSYESIVGINYLTHSYLKYGVEFDIQMTNENLLICYHDETLERLHNSNIKIYEIQKEELLKFNIAILEDVFDQLTQTDNLINIEIKYINDSGNSKLKILCYELIKLIESKKIKNYVITSFNSEVILQLLNMNINNVGLILSEEYDVEWIRKLVTRGMKYLTIAKNDFDLINKLNFDNIFLLIYTFFDNVEDYDSDIQLINQLKSIKDKKIGLITDDHELTFNLLLNNCD